MASLIKRKEKDQIRYYLKYSSRCNPGQKYLGTRIPKDVSQQKIAFELICYRKDKGTFIEKIHQNYSRYVKAADKKIIQDENHGFKIIHTYSTQKIEGSAMTLGQTRQLLETGLSPKNILLDDIIEARQIAELFDQIIYTNKDITSKLVLHWHNTLFQKTDTNNAGTFRRQDVQPYLGKTEYASWYDISDKILYLIRWYNKEKKTMNPVELSARFHQRFEVIHPFIDGNGRIGRLLMILILNKAKYPILNIRPQEKHAYINKLESAHVKKDEMIFVKWLVSKYLRDNKKFLD